MTSSVCVWHQWWQSAATLSASTAVMRACLKPGKPPGTLVPHRPQGHQSWHAECVRHPWTVVVGCHGSRGPFSPAAISIALFVHTKRLQHLLGQADVIPVLQYQKPLNRCTEAVNLLYHVLFYQTMPFRTDWADISCS